MTKANEWDIIREKFEEYFAPIIREDLDQEAFQQTMAVLEKLKVTFQEHSFTQKEAMQIFLQTLALEAFKRIGRIERRIGNGKNPENI